MDTSAVFEFERDFAGSLRCIPMAVRFKLDHCGIKLSLRQWSRFSREDRAQLLERPGHSLEAVPAYRDYLVSLIESRAKEPAVELPADAAPPWRNVEDVPDAIFRQAESLGVSAPSAAQWAALTPLQRFTLLKLARPGHDNKNFLPALREFALLDR